MTRGAFSRWSATALALALLGGVSCGGHSSVDATQGEGTTSGAGASALSPEGCAVGYPYCATLDACLLPHHLCPPASAEGPSEDAGGSGRDAGAPQEDAGAPPISNDPPDAPVPDPTLSLSSTPNEIRCGDQLCDINAYCCLSSQDYQQIPPGATFNSCGNTFCPLRRECDETADCVGAEVCCYSVVSSPPAVLGNYCSAPENCGHGDAWIACATQDDCSRVGAPPCMAQECAGTTVQTCGPISRSACKNH